MMCEVALSGMGLTCFVFSLSLSSSRSRERWQDRGRRNTEEEDTPQSKKKGGKIKGSDVERWRKRKREQMATNRISIAEPAHSHEATGIMDTRGNEVTMALACVRVCGCLGGCVGVC